MSLSPKTRLGTYEIISLLGIGGMGEVYRAKDLRLGRDVAIKVLMDEMASNADRLARFEREARAVAGLNHPNIVTIFSVEYEDGIHFLTMELIEGQDLSQLVSPDGMPLSRILELHIPLADALAAAHDRGVIHRDLKPANVMVTRDGRLKVLDFGLAKLVETEPSLEADHRATASMPLSAQGQIFGTLPYMSPEQIRGEKLDARSDLFSLGIILYELATGLRPFKGKTSADVSSAILRDTPEPLSHIRSDLPVDLERLIIWCLKKNPRERIQSALDISNELRRLRNSADQRENESQLSYRTASIAVLPFVNRSRSEEDEYFSDGLADEILNMLAKIRGLQVAARFSSFQFKGKNEELAAIGAKLAKRLKKVGVLVGNCYGFVGNRMLHQYGREANFLVEEGAKPQDVDGALYKFGMAMGPFTMYDMAGMDIGYAIRQRRYVEKPHLTYSRIADRVVELGRLGQKSGKGWYLYEPGNRTPLPDPEVDALIAAYRAEIKLTPRDISDEEIVQRCVYALVNEGAKILDEGIALRASDIDVVYLTGYGFPVRTGGPMFYAQTVGLDKVVATMKRFAGNKHADPAFWQPAPLLAEAAKNGRWPK